MTRSADEATPAPPQPPKEEEAGKGVAGAGTTDTTKLVRFDPAPTGPTKAHHSYARRASVASRFSVAPPPYAQLLLQRPEPAAARSKEWRNLRGAILPLRTDMRHDAQSADSSAPDRSHLLAARFLSWVAKPTGPGNGPSCGAAPQSDPSSGASADPATYPVKDELLSMKGGGQSLINSQSSAGRAFVNIALNDVSFHVKKSQVLKDLNVVLRQGELVALMGESGSGKTTMLNVLGGRATYGKVSGEMTLNGEQFEPALLNNIGYVPQANLFFKHLSVYENLMTAADLKLGRLVSRAEKRELVEAVLILLGLSHVRHFLCDKNLGSERLSGGQLRRVSIGLELVAQPVILLLDEPTSSLDAVNTRLVVDALKGLAQSGMLVVASLHQPRFSVYNTLDKVIVMRRGEIIYGGSRELVVPYVETLGFELPLEANPADILIEIAFGFVTSIASPPVAAEELGEIWRDHARVGSARLASAGGKLDADVSLALMRSQATGTGPYKPDELASFAAFCEWYDANGFSRVMRPEMRARVWEAASAEAERIAREADKDSKTNSPLGMLGDAARAATRRRGAAPSSQNERRTSTWFGGWREKTRTRPRKREEDNSVPWSVIHDVVLRWPVEHDDGPGWCSHFVTCMRRYALKLLRTRKRSHLALFLVVSLGGFCGVLYNASMENAELLPICYLLTVSLFACTVASSTIGTFGGVDQRDIFAHEVAGYSRSRASR